MLDKSHYQKSTQRNSYTLVMALNFYGRMLLESNELRKSEAEQYIRHSEEISDLLPPWFDKLDNMYVPPFELD